MRAGHVPRAIAGVVAAAAPAPAQSPPAVSRLIALHPDAGPLADDRADRADQAHRVA